MQLKQALRGLLACLAAGFCLFAVLSDDVVERTYPTLQAARADRLFEKGWLPDVLPPSAVDIRISNNLDVNDSAGEFRFDPREYPLLLDKTSPYLPHDAGPAEYDWFETNPGERDMRFVERDGRKWLFVCDPVRGTCRYEMVPASREFAAQ